MAAIVSTLVVAASAASSAVATAAASSTVLTTLAAASTGIAALSAVSAGISEKNRLKTQANEEVFKSRDEFITGVERTSALKRNLAETLDRQQVQFAAGGVDLGSVSVEAAQTQVREDAERELGFAQNDSLRATLARNRQARNLRVEGNAAFNKGLFSAAGKLTKFAVDEGRRG